MQYLNKIIAYGLYLVVFLLPIETRWIIKAGQLNHGPWEYGTYSLYATDMLLIFVLLLFIIYKFLERRITNYELRITNLIQKTKYEIQNLFIFGLILASVMSIFSAADKSLALYKFGWLASGVGLFWLITKANYDRLKLIYAMLVGAFLSASLAVWQFLSQSSFASKWLGLALHRAADPGASVIEAVGAVGTLERWLRAYGSLDHPNILGGMLTIGILLLIGQIIFRERANNFQFPPLRQSYGGQAIFNDKIFKFVNWFLLLVFTAGLFFSFSRSAWLALASGLAVIAALAIARGNLKLQKGLSEIILIMGILLLVLFSQYQNLITARLAGEGRLEAKSNFERLASYQEFWQLIKNNLLWGTGLGNYTLALRDEIISGQASYYYQPTHNVFLLVWAEIGVFGLLFFLGLIIYFLILNYGKTIGSNSYTKINLAVLVALIVIMSLDHWLWSLHFGGLFFWLVLGLVYRKKLLNN